MESVHGKIIVLVNSRHTTTRRYFCIYSFQLVHLIFSFCCISFTLSSYYQFMLGFVLHTCQVIDFLTRISLSCFKLAACSHMVGIPTMITGLHCADVERHLVTATVLHSTRFFTNGLCHTIFAQVRLSAQSDLEHRVILVGLSVSESTHKLIPDR